jgi:CheY-like chemotaxis protein
LDHEENVRWLRACIWPEATERYHLLDAAITLAKQHPPKVIKGDARLVLPELLDAIPSRRTVCLWHSFAQCQGPPQVDKHIEHIMRNASQSRTIYELSLEVDPTHEALLALELTIYQHGRIEQRSMLASCTLHGEAMQWRKNEMRKITFDPVSSPNTDPSRHKLIMLIDDSPTVRKTVETCLTREGFALLSFPDGLEALRWFTQPERPIPDLVILDIVLPSIDGYEVARRFKTHPRLKETTIVFLSRRDGLLDRLKGRLVGAHGFLSKPLKTQDVLSTVNSFLVLPTIYHHGRALPMRADAR